ncbi:MAG: hypothetical protein NZ455_01430 [Bacteroidia bacterium]|nr:hypothetical protein [Bacteroidia bacterium]MDW8347786.1 hypothetical protein [Bacteroidia bacterium]
MTYFKKWAFYTVLSVLVHVVVLIVSQGFWVELDSPAYIDLARTRSLSFCKPIGYPIFLFLLGIGAKYLWIPVFVQLLARSAVTSLIICYLQKQYQIKPKKVLFIWLIFHIEPQQLYYNTCIMVESLLLTTFLAQWYLWQQYLESNRKTYLYGFLACIGVGLYLKPIAIISIALLCMYGVVRIKSRYRYIMRGMTVYGIFYISVGTLYYWRYNTFDTDIFRGILLWNNASVLTPVLKQDNFKSKDSTVNLVLEDMYSRDVKEFAYGQDGNRIFGDSGLVQQYVQMRMSQSKDYRLAIVETNRILGRTAWVIITQYPIKFIEKYLVVNVKNWLSGLWLPHDITYLVPEFIATHKYTKTYKLNTFVYVWHSTVKLFLLTLLTLVIVCKIIRCKGFEIDPSANSILHFIWLYVVMKVVLHPFEYRYIHPVLGGLLLLSAIFVAQRNNNLRNL